VKFASVISVRASFLSEAFVGHAWQLDSCLSDAVPSEVISSLQEAPWEVLLASKLLHERHASHLFDL
jgi:hypothetical protein